MTHGGQESHDSQVADAPVHNPIIERLTPLILHLAYEVDPWVQVKLLPYRWRDEDLLDIGLSWQGHEHHLQVSASRLELIEHDPHMLEHDIAGAIGDMKREAGAHPPPPAPGGEEGTDHEHGRDHAHLNRRQRRALMRAQAEAQAVPPPPPPPPPALHREHAATAPQAQQPHAHVTHPTAAAAPDATAAHAGQAGGHATVAEFDAPPVLTAEEQRVYEGLTGLVRGIVHHLDPHAVVSFELYQWHGAPTVDVVIDRHGAVHHYEVTLERAHLFVDDHHMLEHDLEGVVAGH